MYRINDQSSERVYSVGITIVNFLLEKARNRNPFIAESPISGRPIVAFGLFATY